MNYYSPNYHHMSSGGPPPSFSTNRFIYVKHNFFIPPTPTPTKVLVNPHFKSKVYVNPQFKPPKPKIHVNPNVLKNLVPKIQPKPVINTTVISTRNKLVRIPTEKVVRKRRNSLHTKYKIVRSSNNSVNKYKLDKRTSIKPIKKKYVYVNRFLSMNVVAKNVLIKKNSNLCKRGFVNINGILYKKSPNSLRKASDSTLLKSKSRTKISSKFVKKDQKRRSLTTNRRYKLIRSKIKSPNKLRKCNIPCPMYRKTGKCPGKNSGTCFKLHNPDQIVLCTKFLQGACRNEKCLLSHKVSPEKMPTCKYYLEGMCSKDDCPYLHVKISPKADICRDFLEGFCKRGAECDKRHQLLCPDFEKNKKCPKKRCPYPHGNVVRKISPVIAKKCSIKREKKKVDCAESNRYYKDLAKDGTEEQSVIKTVSKERPKLGELPAFIPFSSNT